jgi:hypothetical protein
MENPRLQAQKSCDFEGFTDIIFRLLSAAWGPDWGTFCEAFPNGTDPANVKTPIITYKLVEMRPGQIGRDTKEIKPRLRETIFPEDDPSTAIEIFGRILDANVVFEIWEENNTKASKVATRFMDFLDMYTGFIKSQGVKEVIFQRFSNDTNSAWKDDLVSRQIEYFVRFEHLNEVRSDVITKVTGEVTIGNQSDSSINGSIPFSNG